MDIDISSTEDRKIIDEVIASGHWSTRDLLAKNPHLTSEDIVKLSETLEINYGTLFRHPNAPLDLLDIYLHHPNDKLKAVTLLHESVPFEIFYDAVMYGSYLSKKEFGKRDMDTLSSSEYVANSLELFQRFWEEPDFRAYLVQRASNTRRVPIDPHIKTFLASRILREVNSVRIAYCQSENLADPAVLDLLKDDKSRAIINAIAANPVALPMTHGYLLDHYPSSSIKISIAKASRDKGILDRIYNGSSGAATIKALKSNPSFTEKRS